MKRVSEEQLADAVASSESVQGVLRHLGLRMAGGTHHHYSSRIKRSNLDTSHFKRQAHNKGNPAYNRLSPNDILVLSTSGLRPKAYQLRRSMIESGRVYSCQCGNVGEWNGRSLTLEVDHISGDWQDNRIENLRFLCPNCHSQEETTNRPHKLE